jgi:hypothetical protein
MRPTRYAVARATLGLLLGASAVVGIVNIAAARTRFDGLWSVSVVTERGDCERGVRYPVAIVNGVVGRAGGDQSFSVAGRVATSGAVSVSVRRGDQFAHGSGRLSTAAGEGRWVSPTSGCAGYWTAQRREQPGYGSYPESPQYREQRAYEQSPYRAYPYYR